MKNNFLSGNSTRGSLKCYDSELILSKLLHRRNLLSLKTEDFKAQLNKYLNQQLMHAINNIPFYKAFDSVVNYASSNKACAALEKFPLINRQIVQNHTNDFVGNSFNANDLIFRKTSGTSGRPLTIYKPKSLFTLYGAIALDTRLMYGWTPFDAVYTLHGGGIGNIPPETSITKLENILFTAPPRVFYCYPSCLRELISRNSSEKLSSLSLKYIGTHSEQTSKEERQTISSEFNCPVYDDYGATEVGPIAIQCINQHYHIISDLIHLEILDSDGLPVPDGMEGEVVVTDLHNRAMPLIRYQTGDIAVIDCTVKCDCRWSKLPILKYIKGRKEDNFIMPNGEKVPAGLLIGTLVVDNPKSIVQWKIVQNSLSKVTINIVKGTEHNPDDVNKIVTELSSLTNNQLSISLKYCEKIEDGHIHKHKVFQCLSGVAEGGHNG